MGVLDWLFGRTAHSPFSSRSDGELSLSGSPQVPPGAAGRTPLKCFRLGVAGESFTNPDGSSRQEIIRRCSVGEVLELVPEPTNSHDKRAVKVCRRNGEQIGYLPRDHGLFRRATGNTVTAAICDITGGVGRKKHLGVTLAIWVYPEQPRAK